MSGYTKLFGSILASTVWELPATTKVVWITLLAMSDQDGEVQASVPGLAKFAGVSREECEAALASFLSPDPDSRSKECEGRRLEAIDGGWLLINHAKYREHMSIDDRRTRAAVRQQRFRETHKVTPDVTLSNASSRPVTQSNASNDIRSESDQKQTKEDQNMPAPRARVRSVRTESEAFKAFYSAYPRHVGRDKARSAWDSRGCEALAAEIMTALEWQKRLVFALCPSDKVPHPASWINAGRWKDERPRSVLPSSRPDPNCRGWHEAGRNTNRRNPRGHQLACPECKSVELREWTADDRTGEPTPIGEIS